MVKFVLTAALAGFLAQGAAPSQPTQSPVPSGQALPQPTISPAANSRPHTDMIGTWTYNEEESLNATTGKPETARAINDRRGISRGGVATGGSAGSPPAGGGFGSGGAGSPGGTRGPLSGGANLPDE